MSHDSRCYYLHVSRYFGVSFLGLEDEFSKTRTHIHRYVFVTEEDFLFINPLLFSTLPFTGSVSRVKSVLWWTRTLPLSRQVCLHVGKVNDRLRLRLLYLYIPPSLYSLRPFRSSVMSPSAFLGYIRVTGSKILESKTINEK